VFVAAAMRVPAALRRLQPHIVRAQSALAVLSKHAANRTALDRNS
jgi:hypothetical protein